MARAIDLAWRAPTTIKTNPRVGCVITYSGKVIGEGFHKTYGEAHAEINAINSIVNLTKDIAEKAKVYVTLEPCSHIGKTPSCARRLVSYGFRNIIIGSSDPHSLVNGKGIEILKQSGCEVMLLNLEATDQLIREFRISSQLKRSYICLKWAQTRHGYMGTKGENIPISSRATQFAVHAWRSRFQGIIIGPDTAIIDNPQLNNRLISGASPIPILLDRNHRVPSNIRLFNNKNLIYISKKYRKLNPEIKQIIINVKNKTSYLEEVMKKLYQEEIKSVFVEGGKSIHAAFIEEGLWDEARVILSSPIDDLNILAPRLKGHNMTQTLSFDKLGSDRLQLIFNQI